MANTIKHKQSSVTGKAPTTGQLALGEIAINTTDGKIFIKKNVSGAETVVEVGQTVVDSHVVSSNPHSQYVRNDIGATQTIASNLSIGSGAVSTLEGGQLDLTAAPTSGLGNCSIGVYGASAGSQNIRFLQRDSSNTVTTLTFPQSGGTAWTSSNDGTGSGLDADLLDGQHGAYYLDWTNLNNKPILGTAASKDTPTSGNAVAGQVVLGNDTRLSDARTPTAHNQSWSTITNTPTTLSGYGITDAQAADADLTAIAGLSGNTGFLKKTAANTWSLDTNTYLTANQSITVSGDASGTGSTAIALTLANSGVTAGTYNNSATAVTPLTVDAKGRITSTGSAVTITPAWSSITSKPTTLSGYGITNAATINSPEFTGTPTAPTASPGTNTTQIATTAFVSTAVTAATTSGITSYANGDISSATLTTSTITSGQVVDQNAATTYRSVKYTVQVKSGTAYQLSELLVLHDGTNAYITEFGNIQTGSTLAVFDADIFGGNLRLLVTPVNAATVIKVIKTLIDI